MADGHITRNLRVLGGGAGLIQRFIIPRPAMRMVSKLLVCRASPRISSQSTPSNGFRDWMSTRTCITSDVGLPIMPTTAGVGSYTTVDIGTRYATRLWNTPTTFRFDITNLTDRHDRTNIVPGALTGYTGAGAASAQLGAPRQAQFSVQVDF